MQVHAKRGALQRWEESKGTPSAKKRKSSDSFFKWTERVSS
jgi:hypothetical protein